MGTVNITHAITAVATTENDYAAMVAYVNDKYGALDIQEDAPNLTVVVTSVGAANVADYEGL